MPYGPRLRTRQKKKIIGHHAIMVVALPFALWHGFIGQPAAENVKSAARTGKI